MANKPRIDHNEPPWPLKRVIRESRCSRLTVQQAIILGDLHELGAPGSGVFDAWEAARWCAAQWRRGDQDKRMPMPAKPFAVGPAGGDEAPGPAGAPPPAEEAPRQPAAAPAPRPPAGPPVLLGVPQGDGASSEEWPPRGPTGLLLRAPWVARRTNTDIFLEQLAQRETDAQKKAFLEKKRYITDPATGARSEIAWMAISHAQEAFLACELPDVFYGGARGGGKSNVCLADCSIRAAKWGRNFRAILFRKTFSELKDVIEQAHDFYPKLGWKFNATAFEYKHENGAILLFRYLDSAEDYERYHGHSVQAIYLDELPSWADPKPLDKLWSILRSAHGVPCVRRCTGNPGGAGMSWVKQRYKLSKEVCRPYEILEYTPLAERPDLVIKATFIPATLDDNPMLPANYEVNLAASAGGVKQFEAWRYGLWDAIAGCYFGTWDPDKHTFGPRHTPIPVVGVDGEMLADNFKSDSDVVLQPWFTRWASIDWGFSHEAAVVWMCFDGVRIYAYREYIQRGMTPTQLAEAIVAQNMTTGPDGKRGPEPLYRIVIGHDAWERRTSEKTIHNEMASVFVANGLPSPWKAQDRSRVQGWQALNSTITAGNFRVHRSCHRLIDALLMAQHDPDRPNDIMKWNGDDVLEAARNGVRENPAEGRMPAETAVEYAYSNALRDTGGDMQRAMMAAWMADHREKQRQGQEMAGFDMRGRRPR